MLRNQCYCIKTNCLPSFICSWSPSVKLRGMMFSLSTLAGSQSVKLLVFYYSELDFQLDFEQVYDVYHYNFWTEFRDSFVHGGCYTAMVAISTVHF